MQLRLRIGYVIQQVGLFPHQTVGANVATVPKLLGWDKARTAARVEELLALVGLDPGEYRDRYPAELSGGQRQRVGVARALAADPPIMLMDEPFGAIDPVTRTQLQDEFLRLQRTIRKTIVFVTHDIDEAVKMGDRIAILDVGGVLAQYDTPDRLLAAPASDFVAGFVGRDRALKRLRITPSRRSPCSPATGRRPAAAPCRRLLVAGAGRARADVAGAVRVDRGDGRRCGAGSRRSVGPRDGVSNRRRRRSVTPAPHPVTVEQVPEKGES